jgi:hypothetical protein
VGYNEHSYAVRDIAGSRIHKSRREDHWGGSGFGPGDVLGVAIYLVENEAAATGVTASTSAGDAGASTEQAGANENGGPAPVDERAAPHLTNHIRFYKNGRPMGNGVAFGDVGPGPWFPAVSIYSRGAVRLNFGPHFVHPSRDLPPAWNVRPLSELCTAPPCPDEAGDRVTAGGGDRKEGRKVFFSKRTNDGIVAAFKDLVKMEATARHKAYLTHLELHRREIKALRKERGLSISNLVDGL